MYENQITDKNTASWKLTNVNWHIAFDKHLDPVIAAHNKIHLNAVYHYYYYW